MTLINGPYNTREIEDLGTVRQKLPLYRPAGDQVEAGYALYEPDPTRQRSFWLENLWDGSVLVNSPDTNSPDIIP